MAKFQNAIIRSSLDEVVESKKNTDHTNSKCDMRYVDIERKKCSNVEINN